MLCYCMLFYSEFPTERQMFQQCFLACPAFFLSVCVTTGTCCSFNEGLVMGATCHWRISKVFAFLFSPSWSVHPEFYILECGRNQTGFQSRSNTDVLNILKSLFVFLYLPSMPSELRSWPWRANWWLSRVPWKMIFLSLITGDTGDVSVSEAVLEQVYALINLRVAFKKRIHAANTAWTAKQIKY